jgi:hypothetical protein
LADINIQEYMWTHMALMMRIYVGLDGIMTWASMKIKEEKMTHKNSKMCANLCALSMKEKICGRTVSSRSRAPAAGKSSLPKEDSGDALVSSTSTDLEQKILHQVHSAAQPNSPPSAQCSIARLSIDRMHSAVQRLLDKHKARCSRAAPCGPRRTDGKRT